VNIAVEKARYGVLDDPQRTRDVREKLQRLVDSGVSSFTVARMAEGDDPAFLVVKTLEFEYVRDGQRFHRSGQDPEVIDLAPAVAPPKPPALVRSDRRGRPALEAPEPGDYEWLTASGRLQRLTVTTLPAMEVRGPWMVDFLDRRGASRQVRFDALAPWNEHIDPQVKYFSGEAVYRTTFDVGPDSRPRKSKCFLDLGQVKVMAEVKLNGKRLGVLWKPPFRLEVTDALRRGRNELEVRVVNLWPNRLIGDEQLPEDSERNPDGTLKGWPEWLQQGLPSPADRQTFAMWRLWRKNDSLLESGLVGPVTLSHLPEPARSSRLESVRP
jgi:hypothetical protein